MIGGLEAVFQDERMKTLFRLAIPAMGENLLLTAVGVVDTFFIAKLGLVEVTSVGVATTIMQIYISVFFALGTAATILVSRTVGEQRFTQVKSWITHSIYTATIVGFAAGILSVFYAKPMLQLLGTSPDALPGAVLYFRIVAAFAVVISLFTVLGSILRGAGDTKSPLKAGIWMNAVHVVLDYVFIFGIGHFQGFGLLGAAMATVFSRGFGVLLLWLYLKKKHTKIFPNHKHSWKPRSSFYKRMARLGFPAAGEKLFKRAGQVLYFSMIVRMGTFVFAAHRLAGNFTIFADVVGTGFTVAASTMIGQQIGRRNEKGAKKDVMTTVMITMASMTGILAVMLLLAKQGVSLFTRNPFVIHQVAWVLGIDTMAQPATAAVLILTAALQAGGDVKFPMVTTGIGIWLFRTLGAYVFGWQLGWGLPGVWFSIALDNYFRAAVLYLRYKKGNWIQEV